jgi:ribokinase
MRISVLGNYMNARFIHVDRLPVEGESLAARRVFQEHGGKGLNLGVGLQRLGVAVDLLMPVGNDAPGAAVTQALAEEGMDVSRVLTLGDASGFGVGFIAADGRNFLAAHLGANALLTPAHVDEACAGLGPGDWLLAHFELPFETVRHALRRAHAAGVTTYLNPSPWLPLDAELLGWVDVLVVNETEAAGLFGEGDMTRADRHAWSDRLPAMAGTIGWRGKALVVTLGSAGSVALDAKGQVCAAAAPTIQQVDATGAGDAFGCGLIEALSHGSPLVEALHRGNLCGAHIAAREGILAHLPRRHELADQSIFSVSR